MGKTSIFDNNDVDKLSLFEYQDLLRRSGQSDFEAFYYRVPGLSIKRGLRIIATDHDNNVLVGSLDDIDNVELYVLHSW